MGDSGPCLCNETARSGAGGEGERYAGKNHNHGDIEKC